MNTIRRKRTRKDIINEFMKYKILPIFRGIYSRFYPIRCIDKNCDRILEKWEIAKGERYCHICNIYYSNLFVRHYREGKLKIKFKITDKGEMDLSFEQCQKS